MLKARGTAAVNHDHDERDEIFDRGCNSKSKYSQVQPFEEKETEWNVEHSDQNHRDHRKESSTLARHPPLLQVVMACEEDAWE